MTAELRHVAAFLAIARCGNFTRAAADLHVSQPALTVQIRQLEATLGVRLFDRNNRNVALTQLGRELVVPFSRVLLDIQSIVDSAQDAAAHRRGVVRVACLPSIASELLPRAIARLTGRHHGITVLVRDAVAARVIDLVKSGEADFGVSSCGRPDRDLAVHPLFADRLVAFARVDHRIGQRTGVTLRELARHPLVVTGKDSSVRELLDRSVERESLSLNVAQEVTYMSTALGMAAAGLGVAVLPEAAIAAAPATLRRIPIRRPVLRRQIGIVTRARHSLQPAAQKLIEVLAELTGEARESKT
jgi:LysR family transcriptional regulator, carnitine catabolism transcriptional activator